jgi:hypothetical protein
LIIPCPAADGTTTFEVVKALVAYAFEAVTRNV